MTLTESFMLATASLIMGGGIGCAIIWAVQDRWRDRRARRRSRQMDDLWDRRRSGRVRL